MQVLFISRVILSINIKLITMPKRYRRADNGRYTTKEYAEKHKRTTVKETDKKRKRAEKGSGERGKDVSSSR
jgi:hypothetical protein